MTQIISASEKKKIIAAIKRSKTSNQLNLTRLMQRPRPSLRHRPFVRSLTQLLEKGDVDVRKLTETLRRKRSMPPRLIERRPQTEKKAVAAAKQAFRYGIEERRKSAAQLAALDSQPASIFLDTPIFIDLTDSTIAPWTSTGKFKVTWDEDVDTTAIFNFDFFWRNESFQDVLISAASVLIAKGQYISSAWATFGTSDAQVGCNALMTILELWNHPPTSPLFEDNQFASMGTTDDASSIDFGWGLDVDRENKFFDVFQGFQLYHNNFFRVPARQGVVFQVGVVVMPWIYSWLEAGGSCVVDFTTDGGFVQVPFVELQVLTIPQVGHPASLRRTGNK
jgi:hypothetical protein